MTCSWCNHPDHDEGCTRTIATQGGKQRIEKPCPCRRQEKQ